MTTISTGAKQVADLLQEADRAVVLTGAGISAFLTKRRPKFQGK